MEFNYVTLLAWVTQTLAPAELIDVDLSATELDAWKNLLKTEITAWQLAMRFYMLGTIAENEKRIWLTAQRKQIVMFSDRLNHYLFKEQKHWAGHPQATQIKIHYGRALAAFEDLLSFVDQEFPVYNDPNVKVTDFRLRNVLPGLRHLVSDLKLSLEGKEIDPKLCDIINKALDGLLMPGKLSNAGAKYIMHLIQSIESRENLNNSTLVELLTQLDFNQPEFYLYQANAVSAKLQQIDGLHEELEYVLQQKEGLRNQEVSPYFRLYPQQTSLKEELYQYYSEKSLYLNELLLLRRTAMQDRYDSENAFRILLGISVPQLALLVRVLKEKEVILREGITEVLTFFSRHFYTEKALFISSHNLLKRSTDVEFSTVLKLWDTLEGMMNWLDDKFQVRDYRRSL